MHDAKHRNYDQENSSKRINQMIFAMIEEKNIIRILSL